MTTIAGRYRLDREVGRGGTGAVWLAEDTVLGRKVALKRIGTLPGRSDADIDRVRREARVSARLNHEHVVVVFDLVQDGDQHWLVMEYIESENLGDIVRQRGPVDPDEAARLIGQATAALAAAHEAGIVHRDVKPSNLLVTPDGRVKLSDFGIARLETDATMTQTGMVVGSPAFLAPEVAGGSPATPSSDMWSLGATIYHAVEGHPPYPSDDGNVIGTMYRIVNEEPPHPEHAGWLTPAVENLMRREAAERWDARRVRDFLSAGPDQATSTRTLPAAVPGAAAGADDATRVDQGTPVEPVAAAPVAVDAGPADHGPGDSGPVDQGFAGEPVGDEPDGRRGSRTRWAIIALAVLAVAAVAVVAILLSRGGSPDKPAANPTPSRSTKHTPSHSPSPSKTASASPSSTPSETASETASATPAASAQGMRGFIDDYFATVPDDPHTTYAELTERFKQKIGGYGHYSGFWRTVDTVTPSNVVADPDAMTVGYDLTYQMKDGSTRHGSSTVDLVRRDGKYLIDDERPRQ